MSPAHNKHQDLAVICERLHRVILAKDAQLLLADKSALPARGVLRVMPSWDWRLPLISLGRKQLDDEGKPTLLMPVRLSWEGGSVQASKASETSEINGMAIGLGHEHGISTSDFAPELTRRLSRSQIVSELKRIVEEGNEAHWGQLMAMESQIRKTVMRAHASVSKEIANSGHEEESVLDEIDLQGVISMLTLGKRPDEGERERLSSFHRMMALMTQPTAFRAVEPIKFMSCHLRRDAQTEIRKVLDDPHVGPKVRQLSRELSHLTLTEFVKAYNAKYPHDHLSAKRALRALSVKPAPHARRVSAIEDYHMTHEDSRFAEVEANVISRDFANRAKLGRVA